MVNGFGMMNPGMPMGYGSGMMMGSGALPMNQMPLAPGESYVPSGSNPTLPAIPAALTTPTTPGPALSSPTPEPVHHHLESSSDIDPFNSFTSPTGLFNVGNPANPIHIAMGL